MNAVPEHFDFVVLGGGPAGHKAAVQGAKAGKRVLLVEREARIGGECVHRGTIPSKTLRESAVYFAGLRKRAANLAPQGVGRQVLVTSLMQRLESVEQAHERYLENQLVRNHVELRQSRAAFVSPSEVELVDVNGGKARVTGDTIVIATGSRPRAPSDVPIDHERVLDSDSILSMIYLPQSLIVMGAGVIASEFATIFQSLGVQVVMVDKGERPLGFLDPEISDRFVSRFERDGGRYIGGVKHESVTNDLITGVTVKLSDGRTLNAERALVALGRTASVRGLNLGAAGLAVNDRGFITVDVNGQTATPHIYAVGDVVGPPALATSSMDQGRRAVRHALGLENHVATTTIPVGVYTIPEIASVGLTETEAVKRHGRAVVGRARFDEIARGHINGETDGLLKLVCDPEGRQILGAHVIGEGATELVHLAQIAMIAGLEVETFVDNIFNFPTLAEAYRVAALDVVGHRMHLRAVG
ncbi:MAG: Si-specific NAD(P)(+) transhydrogenase [Planctomycetota bacterium]|nr:Si-specific NAD(P)(+) transhydrogenase [Planctomycetota bacterium]